MSKHSVTTAPFDLKIDPDQFKQLAIEQERRCISDLPMYVQQGAITQEEAEEVEKLCLKTIKELEEMK